MNLGNPNAIKPLFWMQPLGNKTISQRIWRQEFWVILFATCTLRQHDDLSKGSHPQDASWIWKILNQSMSEISELLDECRLVTQNFHIVGWLFPLLVVGLFHQNDGSILRSYLSNPRLMLNNPYTRSILHGYFKPLVFWYQWEYLRSPAMNLCVCRVSKIGNVYVL